MTKTNRGSLGDKSVSRKTTPAKEPTGNGQAESTNWEEVARSLASQNESLQLQVKALRGQLIGVGQMLQGVEKTIFGVEPRPDR